MLLSLIAMLLVSSGSLASQAPSPNRDLVLVVKVVEIMPAAGGSSVKPWVVTTEVGKVVRGRFGQKVFSFAVHSPVRAGLEVGQSHTIKATWDANGYSVDETQFRRRQGIRTTVVDVRRPTVIVFVPPQWAQDAKSSEGTVEMIAHVRFAVGDVNKCKGTTRIAVRMVFADRLALTLDGKRSVIDLSSKYPDSAGAYFFRPGKKPCSFATPNDTAFLGYKLSQAAGEFFEVPGCAQQGVPDVCTPGAG